MSTARFALTVVAILASCSDRNRHHLAQSAAVRGSSDRAAPTISWSDNAFVTRGLPAVARGAPIVVLALRENDTGRGFPNLRLDVRDRSDRPMQSIEVLNSNEYETLAPAGIPTAALASRIASANAELERLHAAHGLVAMKPLEVEAPRDGGEPHVARGDGLVVDWRGDRLDVMAADRKLASVDGRSWLAPSHPSCAACAPCENPAFLGAIYHAPGVDVVVAQIRYHGTDACWEPSDKFHVVAW